MIREVDLVSYLPPFIKEFKEIAAALEAENPEFVLLWKAADRVLKNEFIETADEYGISRWEKMLHIQPKNDNLEERKITILSRNNLIIPLLNKQLEMLCGAENYSISVNNETYTLNVSVGLVAKNNVEDVAELLEKIVPENMSIALSIKYNRHSTFYGFTNADLTVYTHNQLRNEVLNTDG